MAPHRAVRRTHAAVLAPIVLASCCLVHHGAYRSRVITVRISPSDLAAERILMDQLLADLRCSSSSCLLNGGDQHMAWADDASEAP